MSSSEMVEPEPAEGLIQCECERRGSALRRERVHKRRQNAPQSIPSLGVEEDINSTMEEYMCFIKSSLK